MTLPLGSEWDENESITIVCGGGNNGGDGRVAARVLREEERDVRIVDAKPDDEEKDLGSPGVIVDALFGTGFTGKPRPRAARLIEQINAANVDVVAVDVPSGVDASTGEVAGAVVKAVATVTFHREKVGLYVAPWAFLVAAVLGGLTGAVVSRMQARKQTQTASLPRYLVIGVLGGLVGGVVEQ